jgi:hypothetical protein
MNRLQHNRGGISLFVLISGLVSSIALGALVMLTATEYSLTQRRKHNELALNIAEAGINVFRWRLNHDSSFYTTEGETLEVVREDYYDTQGILLGAYELHITPPSEGSNIITVLSTGITEAASPVRRSVSVRFGTPSLARFAFLHNSNVWFGQGMTIYGPVFSNGGIRQDGHNTSTLQTTKETYTCGVESGCSPSDTKPGIWGKGGPQELWEFPVTAIDFNSIVIDFNRMKTAAQINGLYLPPAGQGYHLVFRPEGTFELYRVNNTTFAKGWSFDYECENLYQEIQNKQLIGTYPVAGNPIIFVEDTVWVEGTVNGRVTIVAARLPINSNYKNIWIPNNLVYLDREGSHKLGLIAQNDIAFTKDVPDMFEVNGALLAQSGRVLRHHYNYHGCKQGNPQMKNQLTIFGSVISNLIAYWNFSGGGGGQPTSGFVKRDLIYDPALFYDPPPFFPTSGTVEMISWNEVRNP